MAFETGSVINEVTSRRAADPALLPYLEATDEAESSNHLARLMIEQVEPLIKDIIGYKLRAHHPGAGYGTRYQDGEDVSSEVRVRLLARFSDLKQNPDGPSIHSLRSYVAVTCYYACNEHLRRKYPRRYSLKHKLRYLLTHQQGFAVWETDEGNWLCGLPHWKEKSIGSAPRTSSPSSFVRLNELRERPEQFAQQALPGGTAEGLSLAALLQRIFEYCGRPIELDDLVGIVAGLCDIKDMPAERCEDDEEGAGNRTGESYGRAHMATELEQREYFEKLWHEISRMSPRHCAALLLNLRDGQGGSAIDLFITTGAARFDQIAAALSMTERELAELWNHLPVEDAQIAARLGLSRQQVINLRKSARERLSKRMRSAGF